MNLHVDHSINGSILYIAHLLIWHKILFESLLFKRFQPGKVRLIVRVYTSHQLNVWTIFVCQIAVPCFSKITAAPGPLLLTRRDMMVSDMKDTSFFSIIISTHKVKVGFFSHVGGRYRNIFVTGNIHTCTVIMFIIYPCRNRELGYVTFTMIHYRMNIWREYRLGIIIHCDCRVCPPQECLCHRSTVVQLSPDLNISLVRI